MGAWIRTCAALLAIVAAGAERESAGAEHGALRIARVYDAKTHLAANRQNRNHWDIYLREIEDQLGLRAEEIPPAALNNGEQLGRYATLLLGGLDLKDLPSDTPANLEAWVRRGGTLIALATRGLDALCGNRCAGRIAQPCDPFTCAATFALRSDALTEGISSPFQPRQRLLIFSDVQKTVPAESMELARLYDLGGKDTGCAAVTQRTLGKGRVFYFAFAVPQTIWVLHQGRPVDRDRDGDGMLRRSDAIVIRPHSIEVLYADEILFLLGNMIGTHPHPLVHQLPPTPKGEIPDALFFWGGDDEGSTTGIQLTSSNWLKKHGLPYHVNAMLHSGGKFGLSVADAAKIKANGHEIAPHFNFATGFAPGAGFAREHVLAQAAAFRQHFGAGWTCSVNHTTRWVGWSEPARWMLEAGGKADNTFVHAGSPPRNPVNLVGFSFGTAFPFWFYDDWKGANQRIEFLEQPITAYECGYDQKRTDFATLHKAIDLAAHYHLTMNMFYHPVYIAEFPACRQAIEEGLRYLNERKIRPLHLGNDGLYDWWKARSQAQVSSVIAQRDRLTFEVQCGYPAGVIVKVPLGRRTAQSATVDGKSGVQRLSNERKFGQNWALVVVPRGRSVVSVNLNPP